MAQAGGWLSRTEGIIEAVGLDCVATGYLLIPGLLGALDGGDASGARAMAVQATAIGDRFDDPDLRAFGTLGHGQALIAMGDTTAGTARLDEVMVSVIAGEIGPITTGIVYSAAVLECMRLFDLARARRSGRRRSPRGATPNPIWCPTAGSASSTGRSSSRLPASGHRRS